MKKMAWFRMYNDFLNDPKMISIAFEDQRHFIALLALKSDGILDQDCSPELLNRIVAQKLWLDFASITDVKNRLIQAELIDENWQPTAWNKRQFKSDHDASGAERQKRFRQKQKEKQEQEEQGDGDSNALRNVEVTPPDTETDTEKHNDDFASFWKDYPNKVNKKPAEKSWSKLSATEKKLAHERLSVFIHSLPDYQKNPVKLHAATYLNNRRWEDAPQAAANDDDDLYARFY